MKNNKKTAIIAVVLVMAIALMGFGFAAWSSTLTAKGVVGAKAEWCVQWQKFVLDKSTTGVAVTKADGTTAIAKGAAVTDTRTATGSNAALVNMDLGKITFSEPGAWVKYTCTVENKGTIAAKLTTENIALTGTLNENIIVKLPENLCATIDAKTGTCTFDIVLQLNPEYKAEKLEIADANFSLVLDYAQNSTIESVPSATHVK